MKVLGWIDEQVARLDGYIKSHREKIDDLEGQARSYMDEIMDFEAEKKELLEARGKIESR